MAISKEVANIFFPRHSFMFTIGYIELGYQYGLGKKHLLVNRYLCREFSRLGFLLSSWRPAEYA